MPDWDTAYFRACLLSVGFVVLLVLVPFEPVAISGRYHPRLGPMLRIGAVSFSAVVWILLGRRASLRRLWAWPGLLPMSALAGLSLIAALRGPVSDVHVIAAYGLLVVCGAATIAASISREDFDHEFRFVVVWTLLGWVVASGATWVVRGHLNPSTGRFALAGASAFESGVILAVGVIAAWHAKSGRLRTMSVIILVAALMATATRAAIAATIAVLVLPSAWERRPRLRWTPPVIISLLGLGLGVLAVAGWRGVVVQDLVTLNHRTEIWTYALREGLPVFGGGLAAPQQVLEGGPLHAGGNLHNAWLHAVFVHGLPGLLVLAVWLWIIVRKARAGSWERPAGVVLATSTLLSIGPMALSPSFVLLASLTATLPSASTDIWVSSRPAEPDRHLTNA